MGCRGREIARTADNIFGYRVVHVVVSRIMGRQNNHCSDLPKADGIHRPGVQDDDRNEHDHTVDKSDFRITRTARDRKPQNL